jgi:hypothetical protein
MVRNCLNCNNLVKNVINITNKNMILAILIILTIQIHNNLT